MRIILLYALLIVDLSADQIRKLNLNPDKPAVIHVSDRYTTTLIFSENVGAIIGNELTDGEEGSDAAIHYSHPSNSKLIALTAREKNVDTIMTLLVGEELYLLHLQYSENPNLAVKIKLPVKAKPASRRIVPAKPIAKQRDRSPPGLMRVLELAKAQNLSSRRFPIWQVNHQSRQGNLTTKIDRIIHMKNEDLFVISGTITNHHLLFKAKFSPGKSQFLVNGMRRKLLFFQSADQIPRRGTIRFWAVVNSFNPSHKLAISHDL